MILRGAVVENPLAIEDEQYFVQIFILRLQTSPIIWLASMGCKLRSSCCPKFGECNQTESLPWLFYKYYQIMALVLFPPKRLRNSLPLAGWLRWRTSQSHPLPPHLPHLPSTLGAVMVLVMGEIANKPCTMTLPEAPGHQLVLAISSGYEYCKTLNFYPDRLMPILSPLLSLPPFPPLSYQSVLLYLVIPLSPFPSPLLPITPDPHNPPP